MKSKKFVFLIPLLAVLVIGASSGIAEARNQYYNNFFTVLYPFAAGTRIDVCEMCHGSTKKIRNPYGQQVEGCIVPGCGTNCADDALIQSCITSAEPYDSDGDGYINIDEINALTFPGDPADFPAGCTDNDGDTYAVEGGSCGMIDCDDTDPAINPGATEVCDGIDNNCDGQIDEGCPTCTDNDGDTYAVEGGSCGMIDCDDTDPAINPGATEVCDGIDNNCDGQIDEGCDTTPPAAPTGLVAVAGDSQVVLSWNANTEPDLHHYLIYRSTTSGGPYNMITMLMFTTTYTDNNVVNGTTYYYVITADDMSGNESAMSNEASATPTLVCTDNDGDTYAVEGGNCGLADCDDSDPAVNPGAAEVCSDGIDNDCDGLIDAADPDCATCTDADGDGYYAEAGCGTEIDCDDTNPDINPGACDIKQNGIDEDCDGVDRQHGPACPSGPAEICDDGIDNDGDGYIDCADSDCIGDPACSGGCVPSPEICDDGIDNDCDGKTDCADKKDCRTFPGC